MIHNQVLASVALLALCGLATPAAAQQPAQIAILDSDASVNYRAAGAVVVEIPASTAGATLPKVQLDALLRAEAAKLGADAVILVTYQVVSPATPAAAYRASGVAVRYAGTQQAAAVPVPVAPPLVIAPPVPVAAPVAPPVPVSAPAVAMPAPAATVAAATAVMHAAAAEQVVLTDSDLAGRKYASLGPVSATVHQKSLITKMSEQEQVQQALRAAAFAMGADAVIKVKYKFTNGMFSKEGDTGSGIAIRFE